MLAGVSLVNEQFIVVNIMLFHRFMFLKDYLFLIIMLSTSGYTLNQNALYIGIL
jgi:hypothetical protein